MQETVPTEGETEFDAERAAEAQDGLGEPVERATSSGEDGEGRRKRRRRRGRRGRRDGANREQTPANSADEAPEGVPVDASVQANEQAEASMQTDDTATYEGPAPLNAPSEPAWSLGTDDAVEAPPAEPPAPESHREPEVATAEPQAETEAPAAVEPETANEPVAASEPKAPSGPPRKGWWQRPFRHDD